jgi:hypothetical protein
MVQWLAFLLHIPEVMGSILSLKAGYPDYCVVFLNPSSHLLGQYFTGGHNHHLQSTSHLLQLRKKH